MSSNRLISLTFPEGGDRKGHLNFAERQLVRLVAEYETARGHAAFAAMPAYTAAAVERDRAGKTLALALRSYGRGFLWGGQLYGFVACRSYVELTRRPGPFPMGVRGRYR